MALHAIVSVQIHVIERLKVTLLSARCYEDNNGAINIGKRLGFCTELKTREDLGWGIQPTRELKNKVPNCYRGSKVLSTSCSVSPW